MNETKHPGFYIKDKVIPSKMSIKEAAKLLGVGRPALSNLVNGKAALSPEMAVRLEKKFGVDSQKLLQLQAEFNQYQQQESAKKLPIGAYVPSWRKITARDIEQWSEGNLEARSLLAVLLRKLINSTCRDLSLVDFPGYDQSQRQGWDGRVDAETANQWVPYGKSGWEFGCDKDPRGKAKSDYEDRIKSTTQNERAEFHYICVTPRLWKGKDKWVSQMQALEDWKSVRAYDASDIEQWLEQSLQAQAWLWEKMGLRSEGVYSLDEKWKAWASVTEPELSKELFTPSVERFKNTVNNWIENSSNSPLIVCGDSKEEALAFLFCIFESGEPAFKNLKDRFLVFSSGETLRKLTTASPTFFPIVFTNEAERALGGEYKNQPTIIIRPRNTVKPNPDIALDILSFDMFEKALKAMGVHDHNEIEKLARISGSSPTILRRHLAKTPAIRTPKWAEDSTTVCNLIPMMFVGAWHKESKGDREIMSFLAGGKSYDEIEKDVAKVLQFDDPPVWALSKFRGLTSAIDVFFAVQSAVTQKDLENFFFATEIILSEKDPALELPEDKRIFAKLYGKSREHSETIKNGICETLILLSVYGNQFFFKRLDLDVQAKVDEVIRNLLTPLSPEKLLSQTKYLPLYAEASPEEFLKIIENDLKSTKPQIYSLMKPASTGIFGGNCPRAGLLWALETLAWKSEQLLRVCFILAKLSEKRIDDNWANTPLRSLQAIFRAWIPQTAAPLEVRIKTLQALTSKHPSIGWELCVAQFKFGHHVGEYSHRPRWRNDASGAGLPLKCVKDIHEFENKAIELALAWPSHDEKTLGELVQNLQSFSEKHQKLVWSLINEWANTENNENRKATLREQIRRFALRRRSTENGLVDKFRDQIQKVYDSLMPSDVVMKNLWLFERPWVHESLDELEDRDLSYSKRQQKLKKLRIIALQEIWQARSFEGLKVLLLQGNSASVIGEHMAEGVITSNESANFIETCLKLEDENLIANFNEMISGFLLQLNVSVLTEVIQQLTKILPPPLTCRLLKCSPFQHETWELVDAQIEDIQNQYWKEVHPNYLMKESSHLNEVIDHLLKASRPRAAFYAVQFGLEHVETSRLKRLLREVRTCDFEATGTYQLDSYRLAEAFNILQNRVGVSDEDMARLELLFVAVLRDTKHGVPNLEKQMTKSPTLFVQALAILFHRRDGGEDPPEWKVKEAEQNSAIGETAYHLLHNIKRIPGTNNVGKIDQGALRNWVKEAQDLCKKYGRMEVGDQKIGEFLSISNIGEDGIWPCEPIREVLEEIGTPHIATGLKIGIYNSRGAHIRDENGAQEQAIADKYRNWSRKLAFEYPYVANLLEDIAKDYEQQVKWVVSNSTIRRRLRN